MTSPDPSRYANGPLDPASRRAFDPTPPTRADWKRVSDGIALRVLPKAGTGVRWSRVSVAALALAACGVFAVLLWGSGTGPATRPATEVAIVDTDTESDPLADFAVLPVATDVELQIATLRGDWGTGLVVGLHPLDGELQLATADEVTVGRAPAGMESAPDFGDEPMVLSLKGVRAGE